MDKLKLDAVVHWSIPVNDLEAAEKFYGEILGLEHVGRLANTPADESADIRPQLRPHAFRAQRHLGHSTLRLAPG